MARQSNTHGLSVQLCPAAGDGQGVANKILLKLPPDEWAQLFPKLEFVRLQLNQVLHEFGVKIKSGFFVNSGLASVLSVQANGKSVEVGLIGNEGFVGQPAIDGFRSSNTRVITPANGTAFRVALDDLMAILPHCPTLKMELHRYAQTLTMQSSQIAACNLLHDVEPRLARWLLMSQDRVGSETLPLTHEFLGQMLGTRRSSVSIAAGVLQKEGMITYTRGTITIVSKSKLENAACECYQIINEQLAKWQLETA